MQLQARQHWVFDMDGTLTVAAHDFDGMREALGLRPGVPILEQLDAMPPHQAAPLHREVERWEQELAAQARVEPDAIALLEHLRSRGARLGILTRNTARSATITLEATGLDRFFAPPEVLGRHDCPHKPSPAGVLEHLRRWGAQAHDAVMVGDYVLDLQAGRAAGVGTVLVDRAGHGQWRDQCDLAVAGLDLLIVDR